MWRGSRARRSWLAYRRAIVALQCCWRRKTARRELRRRRTEAREATKLLQDKQNLDAKLKETMAMLENVQNQRNEIRQSYKVLSRTFLTFGATQRSARRKRSVGWV